MKSHNKKLKPVIMFSVILLGVIVFGAVYLSGRAENKKVSSLSLPVTSEVEKESKLSISAEERQRMDLYISVMKAAFEIENGGDSFVAVKLDTLKGLSSEAKEAVIVELRSLSPKVYSSEDVKNDTTKFELDQEGRIGRSIDGTLLWVEVEEYTDKKATLTGVSWFGNLGAVFPKYEATYKNGTWQLTLVSMAIS